MAEQDQIRYLTHQQIDKIKWDQCIHNAPNGLIYAYSFYLDTMAKHWDALVLKDYELVMPLTWNKKFGITYLYQPPFIAVLGLFGKNIKEDQLQHFIEEAQSRFRFIEIALNPGNILRTPYSIKQLRSNYILNLNKTYNDLVSGYRENHLRNIRKTFSSGCTIKKDIAVEEIIRINVEQTGYVHNIAEADFENFKKLFYLLKDRHQAETYAIIDHQNKIMASCVFFYSHDRAYYILVGNTPDGKTIGASHALIDTFIKDNASTQLILDFEGSDIPNLAFFYSGFGAKGELYSFIKINRLPFFLKWFKK